LGRVLYLKETHPMSFVRFFEMVQRWTDLCNKVSLQLSKMAKILCSATELSNSSTQEHQIESLEVVEASLLLPPLQNDLVLNIIWSCLCEPLYHA
jgi:hypothetical protein